jgi:hypothetical protein
MPATTARKGSAAYEKGIREGQAMASRARRSTAPEPEETEEEGEEEEMDMASTNRKRSAKGAKNTKAPMDGGMYGKKPMDGECGCSGKKGGKCDGSCGGAMRKRGDAALTPHEYLGACDLGIQDRSRSYIRARLDAAERLDLKCGKGAISKGEKCTKGAATTVDPKAPGKGKGMGTALKVAAGVALVGAAAFGAKKYGPKAIRNAKAGMLKTKRSLQQTTRETMRSQMKKEGATPAQWAEWSKSAPKSGSTSAQRESFKDFFYKNTPGARRPKSDSVYASGFALDTSALAS